MNKILVWSLAFLMGGTCCFAAGEKGKVAPGKAMDISKIDKNFKTDEVGGLPVQYRDALAGGPFRLSGFPWGKKNGKLYRVPAGLTEKEASRGVLALSNHTSGGQISFRTDSRYIAIRADVSWAAGEMGHMPRTGSSGFDFYEKTNDGYMFRRVITPSRAHVDGKKPLEVLAIRSGRPNTMRSWRVNLPLYNGVGKLEIGLEPGAKVEAPEPYSIAKPILFYGSSITQGGCASRPGNNYSTMLCNKLDAPQINLGFSGNAKGEIGMAKIIASLDLAAFVFDYDYNAPNAAHLKKTHEPFFRVIREARPDLPVLILSRVSNAGDARVKVIRETYEKAVAAGDKNVYFIEGRECFAGLEDWRMATVDGCHPNDLGFYLMYQKVLPVLKKALGK